MINYKSHVAFLVIWQPHQHLNSIQTQTSADGLIFSPRFLRKLIQPASVYGLSKNNFKHLIGEELQ